MAVTNLVRMMQELILHFSLGHLAIAILASPFLYIVANEFVRKNARIPNLRGPRGLPVIGNLHQIRTNAAEQYRNWTKSYGAVYQIQLGNIPIVVVNTAAAARAIFGQNASALSSRPEFYTFHKVLSASISHSLGRQAHEKTHRFSRIPLAQRLALLLTVTRSSDVGREQPQPLTGHQCKPMSHTSMLRRRISAKNY
jgi:3-hydroxyphenylacetate 6-hydroxylase